MQSCRYSWLRAHIHTSPVAAQEALDNPICSPAISEDGTRRVRRGSRPQHQIEEEIDTSISSQPGMSALCLPDLARFPDVIWHFLPVFLPSTVALRLRIPSPPSSSLSRGQTDSDRGASWTREQVIYLEETFTSSLLPSFLPSSHTRSSKPTKSKVVCAPLPA